MCLCVYWTTLRMTSKNWLSTSYWRGLSSLVFCLNVRMFINMVWVRYEYDWYESYTKYDWIIYYNLQLINLSRTVNLLSTEYSKNTFYFYNRKKSVIPDLQSRFDYLYFHLYWNNRKTCQYYSMRTKFNASFKIRLCVCMCILSSPPLIFVFFLPIY